MKKKRVVVTGLGVVSCLGNDVDTFYNSLLEGKSGISPITEFPVDDLPTRFAGIIHNFDSGEYIDKKQARRIDKFISYGIVAGKKSLESAGLYPDAHNVNKDRCGIIMGSGMGGMAMFANGVTTVIQQGAKRLTPFFVPFILTNMAGGMLAMDTGFRGPNYSVSSACATGNHAILCALKHIRDGEADLMVTGGVEAAINPVGLAGFCAVKALSTRNDEPQKASRPWDKDRDGFVMGEGAGVLVLESLEHALARGAKIYGEILGGGASCDAYHITEPALDGAGVALCINSALKDAGVKPEDVNYINAHATSTPAGDMAEIKAIKQVIPNTKNVIINCTKSMVGHALGGAGGIEAVAVVKALETGIIHPTINLDNPEDGLDFIVPTKALKANIKVAISNSFGFGGHNAVVVFAPYKG
jgi:3-oxoacyl-[acyl-carrier-protein] synthase II